MTKHERMTPGQRWATYVSAVTGNAPQAQVAIRGGVHQTTVSRWQRTDEQPSFSAVLSFARGYGVNVLGALVEAGYITEAEARSRPRRSLRDASTGDLLAELASRAGSESVA